MVIMDEATRYLSKERGREGQSFQTDVFTRNWEAGLSIVSVVHQTRDRLDDCVKASGAAKIICGGLADGADTYDMAKCMALPREWTAYVGELGPRDLLVRDFRFPEPFAARTLDIDEVPEMAGLREVTDEEVAGDIERIAAEQEVVGRVPYRDVRGGRDEMRELGTKEERLLWEIHNHPLMGMGAYSGVVGSVSYGSRIASVLRDRGYLGAMKFSRSDGGNMTIPFLTAKGLEVLGVEGKDDGGKGRGGTLHRQFAVVIAKHYETEGFRCRIEEEVSGKRTDVVARSAAETVAVEIVISDDLQREQHNLDEDLARFDRIVFATRTKSQVEAIGKLVKKADEGRASFRLLSDYLTGG